MPIVPTYNAPQVREDAFRPVYQREVDVSSGGRALAAGLGALGEAVDKIDLREAQDAAFKAEAEIREQWQQQRAALRNQYKKDNADQYQAAADDWWKKAQENYSKTLTPRAQQLANKSIAQYKLAQDADTLDYVSREKSAAREINFRTLQSTLSREALQEAAPDTAGAIAAATARRITENAIRYAAAEGLSSDVGQAMAREQVDTMHKTMAIGLASRPDGLEAAKSYIAEFGKDMPTADRVAVERQIEVVAKQAQREREEQASDQAWQLFAQNRAIPESILSQMDGRERAQLAESQRAKFERALTGKPVKTDMATYIELREKLAAGERVDLRGYTEKIGAAQMEQLIDIQTAAARGGPKQDTMLTDEQRVAGALISNGIDSKKDPQGAYAIRAEIDRRVRAESAARGGKDLTGDEKQRIVDTVMMDKVFVDEWGRDPEKPLSLVKPEELDNAYVRVNGKDVKLSTVPSTDRQQIIASLKRRGLPTTEQNIVQIYLMKKGQ